MADLEWKTVQMRLGDLIEWGKNPRQLSNHDAEHLQKSLEKFGVVDPLVVNLDGGLIGGHQRKHIMELSTTYGEEYQVDVRVPSRQLDEKEAEELAIRLNKNTGDWDFDILGNEFETADLISYGFTEQELGLLGDLPDLDDMQSKYGEPGERDFWPKISVQVSPETFQKYRALMDEMPGADEAEKFDALISGRG